MFENSEGAIKKWKIQRNWQHRVHIKTKKKNHKKNTTKYVLDTTMHKQTQITEMY